MKTILVRVTVPDEDYDDVCDELVLADFEENPKAFQVVLVKDTLCRFCGTSKDNGRAGFFCSECDA